MAITERMFLGHVSDPVTQVEANKARILKPGFRT